MSVDFGDTTEKDGVVEAGVSIDGNSEGRLYRIQEVMESVWTTNQAMALGGPPFVWCYNTGEVHPQSILIEAGWRARDIISKRAARIHGAFAKE